MHQNEYNPWVYKVVGISKVLALVVALCGGFYVTYLVTSPPSPPNDKAVIAINAAPSDTKITLDNQTVKPNEYTVQSGKHVVTVSKEGFASQTITKDIQAGSNVFMGAVLQSNSNSTKSWYAEHPDDQQLAEAVTGASANISGEDIAKEYPIMKKLPVDGLTYKIDYGATKQTPSGSVPIIYVSGDSAADRQSAIKWMKYYGFDPSTMNISFLGTINPFAPVNQNQEPTYE